MRPKENKVKAELCSPFFLIEETLPPPAEAEAAVTASSALLAAAQRRQANIQNAFMQTSEEMMVLQRRAREDIARAHKFAIENFADGMVPVKESLERALDVDSDSTSIRACKEGVEMTLQQLISVFEKHGLYEINPCAGEKFDPTLHKAVSIEPSEHKESCVICVLQKGYMISDRLLRPALVKVSQRVS